MSNFTLTIDTENAAFGDSQLDAEAEVARILRVVAGRLDEAFWADDGTLRDANGNTVGRFVFEES